MPYEFKSTRRVEFADTDLAGIAHFSVFYRYMESVEHEFFRSLGFSIDTVLPEGKFGWPRVHASCDFRAPLKFEDEARVHLVVKEKRSKSLTYEFRFTKHEGDRIIDVATGTVTAVCVTYDEVENRMRAVTIPASINQLIEPAPPELFQGD